MHFQDPFHRVHGLFATCLSWQARATPGEKIKLMHWFCKNAVFLSIPKNLKNAFCSDEYIVAQGQSVCDGNTEEQCMNTISDLCKVYDSQCKVSGVGSAGFRLVHPTPNYVLEPDEHSVLDVTFRINCPSGPPPHRLCRINPPA